MILRLFYSLQAYMYYARENKQVAPSNECVNMYQSTSALSALQLVQHFDFRGLRPTGRPKAQH